MGCCSITLLGCYSFTLVAIVSHYQIPTLAIPPMLLLLFFRIVSYYSYCIACVMVRYYPPLPSPCVGGALSVHCVVVCVVLPSTDHCHSPYVVVNVLSHF
jgi:hypothetical protein